MQFQTLENIPAIGAARRPRLLASLLLAFAAGFISIVATFAVNGGIQQHLVVWPVSGILLAVSLPWAHARRSRRLPVYLAGGSGVLAGGLLAGMPWWLATALAGLTVLDLLIADLFVGSKIRTFEDLKKRQNGLRLILASVAAPLLTGLLGALRLASFLKTPMVKMAAMSSLANALGIAIGMPLALYLLTAVRLHQRRFPARPWPLLLSSVFFVVVCCWTFWQSTGPYLFLIFPALIWLLLTAGLEGAIFSTLLISLVGSFATAHGHGPICLVRNASPDVRLITLQVFIWVSIVTALPVGAALEERSNAERIATKSFSVQRAILKHTREAIILSSLDGAERYASYAIEQITGWTSSEYLAFDRLDAIHPDDRARARQMIESLSSGSSERTLRYRILHKNGNWSWVEASLSTYGEGRVEGYVGTIRDISRLIEIEEGRIQDRRVFSEEQQRLTEAEHAAKFQLKLRDEFLSHVSHELRSPLTSICSFTSIIADGLAGETTSEQNEYLDIVLKNAAQLQAMIEDLLTVTQSREGKLTIELQSVSLTEAVSDSLETLRGSAGRKRITLSSDAFPHFPAVCADPIRLRQVLIILLDNAIKFTPEGGSVRVTVAHTSDFLLTQVIDTGRGIPADHCELVFDKLYQVEGAHETSNNTGRTGLGLGLHIARSLITRQSGRIWVTSVPGEGSTFHFTLPLYKAENGSGEANADMLAFTGAASQAVL